MKKVTIVGCRHLDKVVGFSSVCGYFLKLEFEKKGIEVVPYSLRDNNKNLQKSIGSDAVINVARYMRFENLKYKTLLLNLISNSKREKVFSIGNQGYSTMRNEILFNMREKGVNNSTIYRIWWAAHKDYFYPEQSTDNINILLDHPHYGQKSYNKIFHNYFQAFSDLVKKFPNIKVSILPDNKWHSIPYKEKNFDIFNPETWINVVPIYRQAHIFCVTHPESLGLSVLESALCGAHIVTPNWYIRPYLIRELDNSKYEVGKTTINQESLYNALKDAIENRNTNRAVKKAEKFTWEKITDKMIEVIGRHK